MNEQINNTKMCVYIYMYMYIYIYVSRRNSIHVHIACTYIDLCMYAHMDIQMSMVFRDDARITRPSKSLLRPASEARKGAASTITVGSTYGIHKDYLQKVGIYVHIYIERERYWLFI